MLGEIRVVVSDSWLMRADVFPTLPSQLVARGQRDGLTARDALCRALPKAIAQTLSQRKVAEEPFYGPLRR